MKIAFSNVEMSVTAKSLKDLIKVLYSVVAVVATGSPNTKLEATARGWAKSAKKAESELGLDVVGPLLDAMALGQLSEDTVPVVKQLRSSVNKDLKADTTVDHTELEMLKALSGYLVSMSDSSLNRAIKLVPELNEPALSEVFVFEASSQASFIKPLEKIVYAFTKEKGRSALTAEEAAILKERSPKVYKEYLRLRKDFNQVWKDELRNFVFASKKTLVPFSKAIDHLDSLGVQHNLPRPFSGLVDANGKLYTSAGNGIAGWPGVGFSIQMNPEYDAKADNTYVFTTVNDTTGKVSQHVYTENYRKKATEHKFQNVQNLDVVIDKVRSKWISFMKRGDSSPQAVAATVLELLYQFSARIGSVGNQADGTNTYGIVTLLGKHFKKTGSGYVIDYIGKSGVRQVHKLEPTTTEAKQLVKNLTLYLQNKGPKDKVFLFEGPATGKQIQMTGAMVNKFFVKLGSPVTVHKLRHVRGTRLFNELIEKNSAKLFNADKPLTEAQALAAFKSIATSVGQLLGHVKGVGAQQKVTPATAIGNYIAPMAMMAYFEKLGYRPPKFLSKFKD